MALDDGFMDRMAPPKVSRFAAPPTRAGRDQERLGWLLILPTILVVLGIAVYPLLESIRLSFTNYRSSRPDRWEYIGFDN